MLGIARHQRTRADARRDLDVVQQDDERVRRLRRLAGPPGATCAACSVWTCDAAKESVYCLDTCSGGGYPSRAAAARACPAVVREAGGGSSTMWLVAPSETVDDDFDRPRRTKDARAAGVAVIFRGGGPAFDARALGSKPLVVGRETKSGLDVGDDRVSREHVSIGCDGDRWTITDLRSHNGTFVDGERIERSVTTRDPRVVRIGQTLLLLEPDVARLQRPHALGEKEPVIGPSLAAALERIETAAREGDTLLVTGESGTGKELAARTFHRAARGSESPFVDVNCAAIPATIAERLLFGTRKGAYSGATTDSAGYVQAADRGVLFLDEIGELDLDVQAKLLRFLETKEVMSLGASTPRAVDVLLVAATNRDLRTRIAEEKFRPDLYYRLAKRHIDLPPLRARAEEIPWLVAVELRGLDGDPLLPSARFVEACLLREWPGNVRELRAETRRAADAARAAGEDTLGVDWLGERAGLAERPRAERPDAADHPLRDAIVEAMEKHDGNVAAVARTLGMHRTQLYRWLKKLGLDGGA